MGGGRGFAIYKGTKGSVEFPGKNPSKPPSPDYSWRGKEPPGSGKGAWYNPNTKETWHPDLEHPNPIGPHWDYIDPNGEKFRVYENGDVIKEE
jgi:hypothetical protein